MYFLRILVLRRKNEEYADRNVSFQKNNKGGLNTGLRLNNSTNLIFCLSVKTISPLRDMENTHKGEKLRKTEHISVNIGPRGKHCRSFLSIPDGLD